MFFFNGRGTVTISADSELVRNACCLRDVIFFFVGTTEDRYFATNELLNISVTNC